MFSVVSVPGSTTVTSQAGGDVVVASHRNASREAHPTSGRPALAANRMLSPLHRLGVVTPRTSRAALLMHRGGGGKRRKKQALFQI